MVAGEVGVAIPTSRVEAEVEMTEGGPVVRQRKEVVGWPRKTRPLPLGGVIPRLLIMAIALGELPPPTRPMHHQVSFCFGDVE